MRKVLLDTNIILDIELEWKEFFEDAVQLFKLIDKRKIIGYITATTITDIYYISKKEKGHQEAIGFIKNLIKVTELIGIDKEIILSALATDLKDFEDAVQIMASELNEVEIILTRNKQDFLHTFIKILTPKEFLTDYKNKFI